MEISEKLSETLEQLRTPVAVGACGLALFGAGVKLVASTNTRGAVTIQEQDAGPAGTVTHVGPAPGSRYVDVLPYEQVEPVQARRPANPT